MTPNETPTPLTDAVWKHHQDFPHDDEGDPWLLASNLERRNAELVAALADLCDEIEEGFYDEDPRDLLSSAARARLVLAAQEGGQG